MVDKNDDVSRMVVQQSDGMIIGEFVETHNWNEDAGLIQRLFAGCSTDEDKTYLEDNLEHLEHKMDSRTPTEYGAELFRGWIVEDILVDLINTDSSSVEASVNGEDSERELLEDTSPDADLSVVYNGDSRPVEVVTDYTEYWTRNGEMDFRDWKIQSIKDEDGLILAVDVTKQEVFIIDPQTISAEYIDSHKPYGGKSAYKIQIEDINRTDISQVASVLETML